MDADTDVYILYEVIALGGILLSPSYLVPWAMLPDVVDEAHDKVRGGRRSCGAVCDGDTTACLPPNKQTGQRHEALYYSYFVFFQKFATGIALAFSTLLLDWAGYITDPCCGQVCGWCDAVDQTAVAHPDQPGVWWLFGRRSPSRSTACCAS